MRLTAMTETKIQEEFLAMLTRCEGIIVKVCLMFADSGSNVFADLYQEIVADLWDGYGSYRGKSAETTWVFTVALHTACMMHRKQKCQPLLVQLDPSLGESLAEETPNPLLQQLYALVEQLSPDDKLVAHMYLSEMSIQEMANALGCSKRTVDNRIRRIKQKLKELNDAENRLGATSINCT
ncbi:MAG: sigma-70 family RNA polymerase sigma factor [Bacteroidales bacterium]|nr:sigma-70 family RNA polymerase sigma factor [Bacteroidales bacterium]